MFKYLASSEENTSRKRKNPTPKVASKNHRETEVSSLKKKKPLATKYFHLLKFLWLKSNAHVGRCHT